MEICLAGASTRRVDDISQLLWGRTDALADAFRQAQEGLRGDRGVEEAPVEVGMPVCVRGRSAAQALLGRARGECGRAGRHRRRPGQSPPRGDRRGRGHAGERGQLGAVLPQDDRARPQGRRIGGRRPVRRPGRHRQHDAAPSEIPAMHGALQCTTRSPRCRQAAGSGRRPH